MELTRENLEKKFARYVLPSVLTQMLMALYTVVDGLFIGRYAGDAGLAGVNLSWPVAAVVFAAAGGIGTGGAVLIGTRLGQGKEQDAVKARGTAMTMLVGLGVLVTVAFSFLLPVLLNILGAEGDVRVEAGNYLQIVILGSLFQSLSCGMAPILRNLGHTVSVMAVMMIGGGMNVALDGLFVGVYRWGARGAAVATVISQICTTVVYLIFLFRNRQLPVKFREFRPHWQEFKSIATIGLSPFGLSFASSITLMFTNWQCLRYNGNDALAAYAVAAYVTGAASAFLSGVGEGIQPLVSFAEGARDHGAARRVFHKGVGLSMIFSLCLCVLGIWGRELLGRLFGCGPAAAELLNTAMVWTSLAFPLMGLTKLASSYLYAGGHHNYASILIYLEPLVVSPLLLLIVPYFLKVTGIWVSFPLTYVVLIVLAVFLVHLHEKKKAEEADN